MIRDEKLIQRISEISPEAFNRRVYRVTWSGVDPLAPSQRGGRWSPPGLISVLYTSLARDGAIAEIVHRLVDLDPWPTKPLEIHEIDVEIEKALRLTADQLMELGVTDNATTGEFTRAQHLGAAAELMGFEGLIVPSVRWHCENLVLFSTQEDLSAGGLRPASVESFDWIAWAIKNSFIQRK